METRASLFLKFSHCFVLLVLYCPFLHHVLKPWKQRNPNANIAATKCVESAIEAVHIAEAMEARGLLHEAYAFTIDVVVMAATSLLVTELGASNDALTVRAKDSSKKAKALLEMLALKNCAAARCLDSLAVSQYLSSTQGVQSSAGCPFVPANSRHSLFIETLPARQAHLHHHQPINF